jgi:hypothetical protein
MADFPDSIYSPRTMVNRTGQVYDADKTKVIYAEDFNKDRDEIVAIEEFVTDKIALGGWIATDDSWTYYDSTHITVPSDATLLYSKGDKIKFTQHGSVKYFSVINVSSTRLTVTAGSDNTVEDTATYPITLPYYSKNENPAGFPAYFNFTVSWDTTTSDDGSGGSPATAGRFRIIGNFCWFKFGDGTGTWKKVGAGSVFIVTNAPVTPADTYTAVGTFSSEQGGVTVFDMTVRVRTTSTVFRIESNISIPDNNALYGYATVYYRY